MVCDAMVEDLGSMCWVTFVRVPRAGHVQLVPVTATPLSTRRCFGKRAVVYSSVELRYAGRIPGWRSRDKLDKSYPFVLSQSTVLDDASLCGM